MEYTNILPGRFLSRPNRFIAHVEINGITEICHVKNTGRCKELLPLGAKVWCHYDANPKRKTHYDLISVEKGSRIINMDSQAPNDAAEEWLRAGGLGCLQDLRREFTHGDSRFDFTFLKDGKRCFLEVKGVTLEDHGIVRFPDAPTQRGAKHLRELIKATKEGFGAYILFVIQMTQVKWLEPNETTDPDFALALRQADAAGVQVLAVDCSVTPSTMVICNSIPIRLYSSPDKP